MQSGDAKVSERVGRFGTRHPLFVAALVATVSVAAADWSFPAGVLVGLLLGVAGWRCFGWKTGLAWLFCGIMAAGTFTWRNSGRIGDERELLKFSGGEVQGQVLADAKGSERFWSARVKLATGPSPGAIVFWEGRGELPVAGSWVKAVGNFGALEGPRNPGDFDQASWLRSLGVAAVFHGSWVDGRVRTGKWAAWGAGLRHGFRDSVTDGLPEDSQEAMVIRAVVIGEQPPDAEELIAAFRNSGTLHAFSVSGLHVTMVGVICWILLRLIGVPRRQAILLLLPVVFGYSWITGNSPPAMRSAWMAAVFLLAFVFRRKPDLLNALGAVLLAAALWDGRLLFQPGVQLSYGVVAAIAIGANAAGRLFEWMGRPELYVPLGEMNRWQAFSLWARRKTAGTLSVSVAAAVGSAPLTAYHFAMVTPVSVLAGLIVVPVVGLLLGIAMLSAALHPLLPSISQRVNQANGLLASFCAKSAEGFAALPGGHFQVRWDTRPFLLVYDQEHGAGAAVFSGGDGNGVLIDCAGPNSFKKRLAPSLRRLGVNPDSVVLSHPDGNHLGGGKAVWETFPIRQAVIPVEKSRSPAFRTWLLDAPRAGVKTLQASDLKTIPLPDGAFLEILHVPDALSQNAVADDRVVIFRLHWRGWKLLLTSDAGVKTETAMLEAAQDVAADVIIAGHHRSDECLGDAFIKAVNPQAIVASHSEFPPVEKLNPRQVAWWRSQGIRVIHQGAAGGVTIRVDDAGNLRLEGFADHSEMILMPR